MDIVTALIDEAREKELFTRTLYRTYLTTGILWGDFHLIIGITNTVAATLAGTSALAERKSVTILFSILATILAALATFLNSGERGKVHIKAANDFQLLNDKYKLFINKASLTETSYEVLEAELLELRKEFYQARDTHPISPEWA